jgi:type VI secretion system protein ImpE
VKTSELFHAGKLREAIAAATDEVRQQPTDAGRRLLLAELLCFTGDLERADNHLDAIATDDALLKVAIAGFRQLIRGEQARQEFFTAGRVPSLLARPEGSIRDLFEASIRVREGAAQEAAGILQRVEETRVHVSGTSGDVRFEDFRDLDDLTCSILEVVTAKGEYFWIPIDQVESLEFHDPVRPRDLLWRRTHMVVRGGPDGEVFLPVVYPGAALESDDLVRLGRTTDWRGGGAEPTRGVGQRTFLVGDEAVPIMELRTIEFNAPEDETAAPPSA